MVPAEGKDGTRRGGGGAAEGMDGAVVERGVAN